MLSLCNGSERELDSCRMLPVRSSKGPKLNSSVYISKLLLPFLFTEIIRPITSGVYFKRRNAICPKYIELHASFFR